MSPQLVEIGKQPTVRLSEARRLKRRFWNYGHLWVESEQLFLVPVSVKRVSEEGRKKQTSNDVL